MQNWAMQKFFSFSQRLKSNYLYVCYAKASYAKKFFSFSQRLNSNHLYVCYTKSSHAKILHSVKGKILTISICAMQNLNSHWCHANLNWCHANLNTHRLTARDIKRLSTQLHKQWIYHIEKACAEVVPVVDWAANQVWQQSPDARRWKSNRNKFRTTTWASRSFCLRIIKLHGSSTPHHLLSYDPYSSTNYIYLWMSCNVNLSP